MLTLYQLLGTNDCEKPQDDQKSEMDYVLLPRKFARNSSAVAKTVKKLENLALTCKYLLTTELTNFVHHSELALRR